MTTNNTDAELFNDDFGEWLEAHGVVIADKTPNWEFDKLGFRANIDLNALKGALLVWRADAVEADRQAQKALNSAERAELESYRHQRAVALEDYHEYGKAPVGSPERLVAYISYLSPHNLRNGVQALRNWQETQKAQEERAVLDSKADCIEMLINWEEQEVDADGRAIDVPHHVLCKGCREKLAEAVMPELEAQLERLKNDN